MEAVFEAVVEFQLRAASSVVRAFGSHPKGRRFNSYAAHHPSPCLRHFAVIAYRRTVATAELIPRKREKRSRVTPMPPTSLRYNVGMKRDERSIAVFTTGGTIDSRSAPEMDGAVVPLKKTLLTSFLRTLNPHFSYEVIRYA